MPAVWLKKCTIFIYKVIHKNMEKYGFQNVTKPFYLMSYNILNTYIYVLVKEK